jgi:hypothetical protein
VGPGGTASARCFDRWWTNAVRQVGIAIPSPSVFSEFEFRLHSGASRGINVMTAATCREKEKT